LMSPKADLPKKGDVNAGPDTTGALPKEVSEDIKVDVNLEDTATQNEGPKMNNISPIQYLPNLADAQFDSPLEDVPMPSSLMGFTQEHWDMLVISLIGFKSYI